MTKSQVAHWALAAAGAAIAVVTELFTTGIYSHSASAATVLFVVSLVAKEVQRARDNSAKVPLNTAVGK